MPIPELTVSGLLPPGIHDTTLEEIGAVFGQFQRSDRRIRLFQGLCEYTAELRVWDHAREILIDGSFVSEKDEPGDIDLIIVYPEDFDFAVLRAPSEYNLISKRRVRSAHGFDIASVRSGTEALREWLSFFSGDSRTGIEVKGVLRLWL